MISHALLIHGRMIPLAHPTVLNFLADRAREQPVFTDDELIAWASQALMTSANSPLTVDEQMELLHMSASAVRSCIVPLQ